MCAAIYRQELVVWVDREMDVCCNVQTGVSNVGGQRDRLRKLMTMRSVTSLTHCVELAMWVDRETD